MDDKPAGRVKLRGVGKVRIVGLDETVTRSADFRAQAHRYGAAVCPTCDGCSEPDRPGCICNAGEGDG